MIDLNYASKMLFIPGIQGMEWIILIVVVVVLIFGARKIPELAKSIGRAQGEFQRGKIEIEKEIKTEEKTGTTSDVGDLKADKEKLLKIAKELGLETEGKTEGQIKEEVTKSMMR